MAKVKPYKNEKAASIAKHNKKNFKKFEHPPGGVWNTGAGDLRNVVIHDCRYDEYGRPVCPFCGMNDKRTLDYNYTEGDEQMYGEFWGKAICYVCNTAFKYYFR